MANQRDIRKLYGPRAFKTHEAHELGITRGALANPKLWRPFNGIRSAGRTERTLREQALAFLPLLRPGDRFSHTTALALCGCPLYVAEDTPIDVESPEGLAPFRRKGVNGHRASPDAPMFWLRIPEHEDPDLWDLGPIPVAVPLRAALQASTQLPFCEIVVALDFILSQNLEHFDAAVKIDMSELRAASKSSRGQRGSQKFRAAAQLARVGGDSRMETLTRLIGERAGVCDLKLQFEVRNSANMLIGRFDMADEDSKSLFEYDGEQHRHKTKQYRRDQVRLDQAREAGWRPLRFHYEDVLETPESTGQKMLKHRGREPSKVPHALKLLLDDRAAKGAISAQPPWFITR